MFTFITFITIFGYFCTIKTHSRLELMSAFVLSKIIEAMVTEQVRYSFLALMVNVPITHNLKV